MSKFNAEASLDDKVNQLHDCLEDLKSQSLAYARSNELENKALRRGHLGIARRMNAMNTHITKVETQVSEIGTKVEVNSALIATAATKATAAEDKLDKLNSGAWRFILSILTIVVAAAIVGVCGLAYHSAVTTVTPVTQVQPSNKVVP